MLELAAVGSQREKIGLSVRESGQKGGQPERRASTKLARVYRGCSRVARRRLREVTPLMVARVGRQNDGHECNHDDGASILMAPSSSASLLALLSIG